MKILPPSLRPWDSVIDRRHAPPPVRGRYGYRKYRQCLRWEFGFTCAFCLCHESDLSLHGAEGTGLTQIEHFVTVGDDETRVNDYTNCLYICRFCNRARGTKSNIDLIDHRRLLNPCDAVWAESFILKSDEIKPRESEQDAFYTCDTYELNDARKVKMRQRRRLTIQEALDLMKHGRSMHDRLLEKAARTGDPELIDTARLVEDNLRKAWRNLMLFKAVPQDAGRTCACRNEGVCTLPRMLDEQTIEVEPPPRGLA